ncbi:MAG: hypothetical protein WKG07_33830, partial [Hymenobacter sp.]
TLYGDRSDGTYAGIDQQHAHLNMPATLCYALGLESRPAEVQFERPAELENCHPAAARAAKKTPSCAPNLAPTSWTAPGGLGAQQVRTWAEGDQTIELAVLSAADARRRPGRLCAARCSRW